MAKKVKKGKKGKKGKKDKKSSVKHDNALQLAKANTKVWAARLEILEKSRNEYRQTAKRLVYDNEELQRQISATEKDTIDVVTYLKKKDQDKDDHIERLLQSVAETRKTYEDEKKESMGSHQKQVSDLEEELNKKENELDVLKQELAGVCEFRKKRLQMKKELEEVKELMFLANKEHKGTLTKMEDKFFEEKMRLQQEAVQKISQLAERAHTEAIKNLDETTRTVYKENVRLSEALKHHMNEEETTKKNFEDVFSERNHLLSDAKLKDFLVEKKVAQSIKDEKKIKQLEEKIELLEKALSHTVREFDDEKVRMSECHEVETKNCKEEIQKLKKTLELKKKESMNIKYLARSLLDQRTELEQFFLDALDTARGEIIKHQNQYRKDAMQAYEEKMKLAYKGKGVYPKVRTFLKGAEFSTNSVFSDLDAAEKLIGNSEKVDITDLTWEQKERVLRYLFAKMNAKNVTHPIDPLKSANAIKENPELPPLPQSPSLIASNNGGDTGNTFLTQTNVHNFSESRNIPLDPLAGIV